jgi:hypothetical protein
MPGRSPHAAIDAYIGPLQRAVSCLPGSGKIQILTTKIKKIGDQGAWVLNGGDDDGLHIPGLGSLSARQQFQLVATEPKPVAAVAGKFRITTLSYRYKLTIDSEEIRWDWHPGGNSPEQRPHMHLSINPEAHLPCARTVFEDVVESCIALGATPTCPDWQIG